MTKTDTGMAESAMQIIDTEDKRLVPNTAELVLVFLREILTTKVRIRAINDLTRSEALAILSIISGGTDSDSVNDEIMEALTKRDDVKKTLHQ